MDKSFKTWVKRLGPIKLGHSWGWNVPIIGSAVGIESVRFGRYEIPVKSVVFTTNIGLFRKPIVELMVAQDA